MILNFFKSLLLTLNMFSAIFSLLFNICVFIGDTENLIIFFKAGLVRF